MTQKKLEPIPAGIDDDFWAVVKTADDDSKKLEHNPARPGQARGSAGGPEMRPDSVESLIKPYVS